MRGWLNAKVAYQIQEQLEYAEQGILMELPQTFQVGEVEAALQGWLSQVVTTDTSPRLRAWLEAEIAWAQINPYSMFRD